MAEIDYLELPAADIAATKAFYTSVFGWSWVDYGPAYSASTSGPVEVALNGEAEPVPLHPEGAQSANGPLVLLRTDDLESVRASVRAAGGMILSDIYAYPGGRRLHLVDPSGNVLGVYQPADPPGEQ